MNFVELKDFTKHYHTLLGERKIVFEKSNLRINEGETIGLLGLNGTGKTTLCNMIAGAESLTMGSIKKQGHVSWPIGIFSSLVPTLTGRHNIYFLSDLLGADKNEIFEIVSLNTELGSDLDRRVATYSAGMKSKLAFFLSLSFKFDFYIFDEVISVGDAIFREKASKYFKQLIDSSSVLLCSHNLNTIKENCNKCYVINDRRLSEKLDIEDGIKLYDEVIKENRLRKQN